MIEVVCDNCGHRFREHGYHFRATGPPPRHVAVCPRCRREKAIPADANVVHVAVYRPWWIVPIMMATFFAGLALLLYWPFLFGWFRG